MRKIQIAITALMLALAPSVMAQTSRATVKSGPAPETDSRYSIDAVKYSAGMGDASAQNQLGAWYFSGKNVSKDIDKAYDLWRRAALQQFPKAISNLAVCYQYGYGTAPDSVAAIKLYVSAIEAGYSDVYSQHSVNVGRNAFDSMLTGLCLEKGIGVGADTRASAEAYAAASDLGSADGAAAAARLYASLGDKAAALPHARRAVAAGNVEGMYQLGVLNGNIQNLEKASGLGHMEAANALAQLVMEGKAPNVDTKRLASILRDNALRGNAGAMLNLAIFFKDGIGVARDYDSAMIWLAQATAAGNVQQKWSPAVTRRLLPSDPFVKYATAMSLLREGRIDRASAVASELRKAKVPEGNVITALIQVNTSNPKANIKKGAASLAKLTGISPYAALTLANLYAEGRGVGLDTVQAVRLLTAAADSGYGPAMARLGDIYHEGTVAPRDTDKAISYYTEALKLRSLTEKQAATLAKLTSDPALTATLQAYRYIDPTTATGK